MPNYKETIVTSTGFSRCRLIEIVNPYQQTPFIVFTEEHIVSLDGRTLRDQPDAPIRVDYDPEVIVAIYDPVTLLPTGASVTMQEIYGLMFSAYFHFATGRDIAALRLAKTQEIDEALIAANRGTFTFMGKQISCDELSRSDIDGLNGIVSLTGALPPDWAGFWKAADNALLAIPDVSTWTGLYAAMVAQGQVNFAHSQDLKAALAAATTAAEVEGIVW